MRRTVCSSVLCGMIAGGAAAQSVPDDEMFLRYIAASACAIGPSVLERAPGAGIDPEALILYGEALVASGEAVQDGDWIVIGAERCTIVPPELSGPLTMDDPAVQAALTEPVKTEEFSEPGCYLETGRLLAELGASRGWDEDQAWDAYVTLVARGIVEGTIRFYEPSPLRTPVGMRFIGSDRCAVAPDLPAMARDHTYLMANLDRLIRAEGQQVECDPDWSLPLFYPTGADNAAGASNGFASIEVMFVARAADWIEGASFYERGTVRPPFCTFGPVADRN